MSDINTVKAQIQSLIDLANTTTGNTDTNLTDGVNALVGGYGQGGSESVPSDMHEVVFVSDTEKSAIFYVQNNVGIQAPSDANGDVAKYTLTQGSNSQASFPYIVTSNTVFYKIVVNITLPSPFVSYLIYSTDGQQYTLAITDVAGFRFNSSSYQLYGLFGAKNLKTKTFNSLDEAITGLIDLSDTGDTSTYTTWSGNSYPGMVSSSKNYPYYSLHDVVYTNNSTFLSANPYEG